MVPIIPKTSTSKSWQIETVSLTDCFAKVSETFVARWVLEDINEMIDTRQYGNVQAVSTAHYLTSLLHFLHKGADEINNIGMVVLTDFSKAFDLVDHTLMIEKFITLGVRGATVPWLCDFIKDRVQCVRYNSTFLDYTILNGGYHGALR